VGEKNHRSRKAAKLQTTKKVPCCSAVLGLAKCCNVSQFNSITLVRDLDLLLSPEMTYQRNRALSRLCHPFRKELYFF